MCTTIIYLQSYSTTRSVEGILRDNSTALTMLGKTVQSLPNTLSVEKCDFNFGHVKARGGEVPHLVPNGSFTCKINDCGTAGRSGVHPLGKHTDPPDLS